MKNILKCLSNYKAVLTLSDKRIKYHRSGRGGQVLLLIPGGPGLTLDYLNIIHRSVPADQFTVITYNPSGTFGNENAPFHKSVKAYADELMALIQALKLESYFLLGHSWGGVIAQEFLFHYPSFPIQGVILANSFTSGIHFANSLKDRAKDLPKSFHDQRELHLEQGNGAGLDVLIGEYWFPKHVCRTQPMPAELLASLTPLSNSPVYYYYLGHDLLNISGAILSWNRTDNLKEIKCPVLIMSGKYDYLTREENQAIVSQIPNGSLWFGNHSGHLPMIDEPTEFISALLQFVHATQNTGK